MPMNKMVKVHHNLVEPQEESLAPVETLAVLQESPAPFEMVVTQGSPAPVKTPAVLQESPAPFEMMVTQGSPAPVETTKTKQKRPCDSLNDGLSRLYTPASTTRRQYEQ